MRKLFGNLNFAWVKFFLLRRIRFMLISYNLKLSLPATFLRGTNFEYFVILWVWHGWYWSNTSFPRVFPTKSCWLSWYLYNNPVKTRKIKWNTLNFQLFEISTVILASSYLAKLLHKLAFVNKFVLNCSKWSLCHRVFT